MMRSCDDFGSADVVVVVAVAAQVSFDTVESFGIESVVLCVESLLLVVVALTTRDLRLRFTAGSFDAASGVAEV